MHPNAVSITITAALQTHTRSSTMTPVKDASLWPLGHRPRPLGRWYRSGGGAWGDRPGLGSAGDFFENGKIVAILGGGPLFSPSFFPSFFLPFFPFPLLSPQVYIQLMLSKTLFYLHFSAIKNHKILFTLLQSGRHLLQHPWRPHSNALHSADEAPLQHLCKPRNSCAALLLGNLGLQLDFLCQNGEFFRKMSSTGLLAS
jgi:hypothetical protein